MNTNPGLGHPLRRRDPARHRLRCPPLPADLNDRVAAVAVFGNPLGKVSGPLNTASPVFGARTIDLCYPGDPICSEGKNMTLHHQYVPGDTDQAATFVANLFTRHRKPGGSASRIPVRSPRCGGRSARRGGECGDHALGCDTAGRPAGIGSA